MPNSLHMDVHPNDVRGFGPSVHPQIFTFAYFCWLNRHVCRFKTAFDCQKAFLIPCRTLWFKPPSTALADSPPLRGPRLYRGLQGSGPKIDVHRYFSFYLSIIFYHFLSIFLFYHILYIYLASSLSKCISYVPRLSYSTAKNM